MLIKLSCHLFIVQLDVTVERTGLSDLLPKMGTKWQKSGTFSHQISVHFGTKTAEIWCEKVADFSHLSPKSDIWLSGHSNRHMYLVPAQAPSRPAVALGLILCWLREVIWMGLMTKYDPQKPGCFPLPFSFIRENIVTEIQLPIFARSPSSAANGFI